MWIDRLVNSRITHAVELTARFAEHRHRILAENVANIDTPDYHAKRLDPQAFRDALHEALRSAEARKSGRLELRGDAQVATGPDGALRIQPVIEPAENILFHDGSNASLERLMTDVQDNALTYQLATRLLGTRFNGLLNAIRGRIG